MNSLSSIFPNSIGKEKLLGGESGIRTHGALTHDGFQDRSVMPASVSLLITLMHLIVKTMFPELFA